MPAQNTLAREIARVLGMQLTQSEQRALNAVATSNSRAYDAYLQGRYVWLQRTFDAYGPAKEYFEQAIALDPKYAPAYAGLADAYQFLAEYDVQGRKEKFERAKNACRRALQLDPNLPEAHASLGLIAMNYDWDWALAEREFRRALALDPNNALIHDWYAEYLMAVGRADLSLVQIEHAGSLFGHYQRRRREDALLCSPLRRSRIATEGDASHVSRFFSRPLLAGASLRYPEALR